MKKESSPDAHVTLKIPRPLYLRLKQIIEGSGFHSVTEFAVYVLRDLASHHGRTGELLQEGLSSTTTSKEATPSEALSPEEIEMIRKRLESLGYL